ncbi:MAG: DinB family protein [Tepidiformaceae bacterium]
MATTIAEHQAAITAAYETYLAELKLAGPKWELAPPAGEGEEAWCARQVAEHIAGAATFFGAGIAGALSIEGPGRFQPSFASAAEAVAATPEAHAKFMAVVGQVPEDKVAMEIDAPRLGKTTIGGIMGIVAHHLEDHAGQLRALREG